MHTRGILFAGMIIVGQVATCRANLVVFGDSLSDVGNTANRSAGIIPPPANGYTTGTFTNGPNWLSTLADRLGETAPGASRTGGTNYGHGGSAMFESAFWRPNLSEQVTSYLNDLSAPNSISADTLHIIWGGANDLFQETSDARAQQAVSAIRANINTLHQSGARRFLVMNLPSLGATPLVKQDPTLDGQELDRVGDVFNVALSGELLQAATELPDIDIVEFDAASFLDEIIVDPAAFGLSNVDQAAAPFDPSSFIAGLATGLPPSGVNPDEYLFYDGLHPTRTAHSFFGHRVADVLTGVPEAAGAQLLLLSGVLHLRLRNRRNS